MTGQDIRTKWLQGEQKPGIGEQKPPYNKCRKRHGKGEQKPGMQRRQGEPKPRKHSRQGTGEQTILQQTSQLEVLSSHLMIHWILPLRLSRLPSKSKIKWLEATKDQIADLLTKLLAEDEFTKLENMEPWARSHETFTEPVRTPKIGDTRTATKRDYPTTLFGGDTH